MPEEKDFYYKKARLTQLRGFCAVMQDPNYSITESAKKINFEQSTLSRQVSSLERDLGTKLFDRSEHKKLKPTKEGDLFYKKAIEYMNGIDSLFENFNEHLKDFNDNHLNIALYYTAATYIFPNILNKLLKQKIFENLNIKIFEISRDEAIKGLTNKEIDIAFYPINEDEIIETNINLEKNIKYEHAIILRKNHFLSNQEIKTRDDLRDFDFLIRDRIKTSTFSMVNYLKLKPSKITFKNGTMDTCIELVKTMNLITGIPEVIYNNGSLKLDKDLVCKNVSHLIPESYFHILTLKNSVTKDSVDFLIEEFRKLVK